MNDTQVFIGGIIVGMIVCYFASLFKDKSTTHISFTIDADSVKLKDKKDVPN